MAHWLGGTQPRAPVPELVAEVLTRRLQRTVSPCSAGFTLVQSATGPRHARRHQHPEAELVALCRADSDPAQRISAQRQPYREADLLDVRWFTPASRPRPRATRHPGEGEIAMMRLAVQFYAASFDTHGGRNTRSALLTYLVEDVAPWLREATSERVRGELLVEASRLSFLLARMYEDASVQGLAQRHFVIARQLAAESGDRMAWAVSLRGLSSQGLALGHRRSALHAAETAAEAGGRAGGGAPVAYLGAQLAVAQAACGLRRQALRSLHRAERALEAAGEDAPAHQPFSSYSPAALAYQHAEALKVLGDSSAACEALNRSLALRTPADRRGLALSHAQRAEILVRSGHVEEACASWQAFLDHYAHLRSGLADTAALRLRQLLTPYRRVPAAAQVLDRIAAGALGQP